MQTKTIVIGGGMAGLSCALQLKNSQEDFIIITDNLGGRVCYDSEHRVNYGALFVMRNYKHACNLLKKEHWINIAKVMFHDNKGNRYTALSKTTLANLPSLTRYFRELLIFYPHYEKFKKNCLHMPILDALKQDHYMEELFHTSAAAFVSEKKLTGAMDSYIGKFIYACTLTTYDKISTLDLLNVSLGLLLPLYLFSFDEGKLKSVLQKELITDSVTAVRGHGNAYEVITSSGAVYHAPQVVLAAPASVTAALLGIPSIRGTSECHTYQIQGNPKKIYREQPWNLFSSDYTASALIKNWDGTYMLYTRTTDVNFSEYFETYEITKRIDWERAMYVHGREFLAEKFADGLYIAGDHNGLGLEPACVSGIHAANRIINRK